MKIRSKSLLFPLADGSEFEVSNWQIEQWQREFPAIDVRYSLLKSQARMAISPRFDRDGIIPVLISWLIRENAHVRSKAHKEEATK